MVTPDKSRKIAKAIGDMVLPRGYNNGALQDAAEALRDLASQIEALQADAERYCWLVENAVIYAASFKHEGKDPASTKQPLDNAIDAARKDQP